MSPRQQHQGIAIQIIANERLWSWNILHGWLDIQVNSRVLSSTSLWLSISIHHLLKLLLLLLLLQLLLLDELSVQFSSASDSDDGGTKVAHRVLSHRRQRRRLLTTLLLRASVKIQCDSVYTAVQQYHCCQRYPEISHLHTSRQSQLSYALYQFYNKKVAVAKKADRILRTTCGTAAQRNCRKCRVWNSHGHATTLSRRGYFGGSVFLAERYIPQHLWLNDKSYSKLKEWIGSAVQGTQCCNFQSLHQP